MGCAVTAGGIAAIVGTPADLILVRLQVDSLLPAEKRRGYSNFFDAAKRIPREEGILSLWRGGVPTISKAIAVNLGSFTTYEESKKRLNPIWPDSPRTVQFFSSFLAGTMAACFSLPFDNAKTKLQKMKANHDGKMPYKNIFDAMNKEVKANGFKGLWVGLPTMCLRMVPH